MRKAFKHTGVLMMAAVIGLAVVGAAYALWFEDLKLTANVSTGTFNADVSEHGAVAVVALPPSTQPAVGGVATWLAAHYADFNNANFPPGKPQPTCTSAVTTFGAAPTNANDSTDNNLLTLTAGDLFPYAGCQFDIDIHNSGSVPFHIAITSVTLNSCTTPFTVCTTPVTTAAPWSIGLDPTNLNPTGCAAFLSAIATWTPTSTAHQINDGANPVQIHSGETNDLRCKFKLILDQDPTAEGLHLQLMATFRAYQWNENPYGP